jgi:hypothetical protein
MGDFLGTGLVGKLLVALAAIERYPWLSSVVRCRTSIELGRYVESRYYFSAIFSEFNITVNYT